MDFKSQIQGSSIRELCPYSHLPPTRDNQPLPFLLQLHFIIYFCFSPNTILLFWTISVLLVDSKYWDSVLKSGS